MLLAALTTLGHDDLRLSQYRQQFVALRKSIPGTFGTAVRSDLSPHRGVTELCIAHVPVNNGINGDIEDTTVAPYVGRWLSRVILRRWETTATDRATVRD
jgi:hypothetical protein